MSSTNTATSTTLPVEPVIPASNASYAKLVGKVRQAAAHGPAAIRHVRDTIKGTNTYAKIVRRYADACITVCEAAAEKAKAAIEEKAARPAVKKAARVMGTAKPKRAPRAAKKVTA